MEKYDINSRVGPAIVTQPLFGTGTPVIDMKDFPYLTEAAANQLDEEEEESVIDSMSIADTPNDYRDIIQDTAFLGEVPFETIMEGIEDQFADYINLPDSTNYVEIFYRQIHASYSAIDDEEEHPEEVKDVLDQILSQFVTKMVELFDRRLSITITSIESEEYDQDELEYIISSLYEFFILHAKENFRRVIVKDICKRLKTTIEDDKTFYDTIRSELRLYSPLVIALSLKEFLTLAGGTTILELYKDDKIYGNVLRKYSPKLYDNEEFEVDLVADITMQLQTREDILKGINK